MTRRFDSSDWPASPPVIWTGPPEIDETPPAGSSLRDLIGGGFILVMNVMIALALALAVIGGVWLFFSIFGRLSSF